MQFSSFIILAPLVAMQGAAALPASDEAGRGSLDIRLVVTDADGTVRSANEHTEYASFIGHNELLHLTNTCHSGIEKRFGDASAYLFKTGCRGKPDFTWKSVESGACYSFQDGNGKTLDMYSISTTHECKYAVWHGNNACRGVSTRSTFLATSKCEGNQGDSIKSFKVDCPLFL